MKAGAGLEASRLPGGRSVREPRCELAGVDRPTVEEALDDVAAVRVAGSAALTDPPLPGDEQRAPGGKQQDRYAHQTEPREVPRADLDVPRLASFTPE
jgi:hypothetical protein